jgi:hypothetical protein
LKSQQILGKTDAPQARIEAAPTRDVSDRP